MSDHIYKTIEITGSSANGIDDAISGAVRKAAQTVHNLEWFQVGEIRGHIADGTVEHVQVTLKIGFRLD